MTALTESEGPDPCGGQGAEGPKEGARKAPKEKKEKNREKEKEGKKKKRRENIEKKKEMEEKKKLIDFDWIQHGVC